MLDFLFICILIILGAISSGFTLDDIIKAFFIVIKLSMWIFGLFVAPILMWIVQTTPSTKYSFWFFVFFSITVISYKWLLTKLKEVK